MTRLVSIVTVYFHDSDFVKVRRALEAEFRSRRDIGEFANVGDTFACIIDARVPNDFALHEAQQRLEAAMPTVRMKMMERFPESGWRRHRWSVAILVGGGIAVALVVDLARASAARLGWLD